MLWKIGKRQLLALSLLALLVIPMTALVANDNAGTQEPIENLQFQSADIRSVLTFLADYGGVNVVIAPEVEGTVTIKLADVQWRSAMEIIARTYGLEIVDEESGYVRVLTAENFRKEQSEMEKHKKEQRELVELVTRIVKIANSAAEDLVAAVESLLSARGKVSADKQSNSLIIQDVPSNIPVVIDFISQLDQPAQQIKISTQLLEIFNSDLTELGVDWSVEGTYTTESGLAYPQRGEVNADNVTDAIGRYSVTALQKGWSATAVVEAIVRTGKGRIVAHPEITTVDNREAKIQMGQKVPIKKFDEAGNVVIEFEEVGTILRVTPHITAENRILMHLIPERSTYEFDPNGVIINTSNAETNVIVNNGQTAVIGGLTTEDEVDTEVGVPILKDIPLLGRLFKYTNSRTETRDLVIFVTPTVVEEKLAQTDTP